MHDYDRQMKLGAFCGGSYHQAGWRHPRSGAERTADIGAWVELARKLEAAKFDMMFVADTASPSNAEEPAVFRYLAAGDNLEPMTLLAAISQHTTHLGLAATIATSYRPPYDAAREILSLDVISGGRVGWNIVTGISPDDAAQYADQNFPPLDERYARGDEFVDVVLKLWNSIEPGAYVRDREGGIYKDLDKIHLINHAGKYYRVRGPLKGVPSPQGRPLLIQAGQSPDGRAMASRVAEAIFTAQSTFEQAKSFRDDIRSRAAAWGRNPDHVKTMPGVVVTVGETRQEAEDKWAELESLIDLNAARASLELALKGFDLSGYDVDAPFPDVPAESVVSRGANHVEAAKREGLSLRQVLVRSSGSNAHFAVMGSVKDIVDQLEHWFTGGACDGFNFMPAVSPISFDDVIEKVVPELRRRGLCRSEYQGRTLRENFGIPATPISLLS
jgi:FMN-dependent oxidoreductase (nitrilotriacetate monooxygenase family)